MVCRLHSWQNLKPHSFAYDIQCLYSPNLIRRIQDVQDPIAERDTRMALPPAQGGVGKFHIPAHSIRAREMARMDGHGQCSIPTVSDEELTACQLRLNDTGADVG